MSTITFRLNEKNISLEADPASRLLDLLREDLGLSAVKEAAVKVSAVHALS